MKRKFLWIPLLLAMALLFSSCSNLFKRESETTGTNATAIPTQDILGKWYCADAGVVIELKDDHTFDYYGLVADDYAYALPITQGSFILSDVTVTLPLEGDFDLKIIYDAANDVFGVDGLELSFSRVDILPAKLGTADPAKFKGIWYSEDSQRVYDLHEDGTVDVYSIKAGYYTYDLTESATYTISDSIIKIKFEGSENVTELIYNNNKNSLSNTYNILFARVEKLPTEHPVVPFPDYSKLDCSSVITLGSYTGRELTAHATSNAILDIFDSYCSANKDKKPVAITEDRAAQYGDRVVIDYTGYLDGVAFSGGSATNQTINLITNSGYIPGLAEGVIGHKMGETFDVPVTFPENYGSKDLAGKAVIFTMKLHTIYDLSLTDEEIKTYTKEEYTTYQQFLDYYIEAYREQEIWDLLQKEVTYTNLPLEYYNYFYQYYRDYYHSYAFSQGITYETLLSKSGLTEVTLMEETKKLALPYIIAQAIYKTENLTWDEEKYNELLDQYVKDAMDYFKYSEEEAKKFVLENEGENLNSTVIRKIVSAWLLKNNT